MARRWLAVLTVSMAMPVFAYAQMPETPGPGGTRIAPGAPVIGHTPGGVGPGSGEIAPGPAARDIPMYRRGPGGVALPPRPDPSPDRDGAIVRVDPGCPDGACMPRTRYQSLQLTIHSRDAEPGETAPADTTIDSLDELFAALRGCWEPPAREQAREGVQMSVRFSFKRGGGMVGPPFVTYTTPGTDAATRQVYRKAIAESLDRCTPLRFSESFGGAIAGRPISVRYIDDRVLHTGVGAQRP
jgi:hypothetical protein